MEEGGTRDSSIERLLDIRMGCFSWDEKGLGLEVVFQKCFYRF